MARHLFTEPPDGRDNGEKNHRSRHMKTSHRGGVQLKKKTVVGSDQHRARIRGAAKSRDEAAANKNNNNMSSVHYSGGGSPKRRRDPSNTFDFLRLCVGGGDQCTDIPFNSLLRVIVANKRDVRKRIAQVPPLRGLLRPGTFQAICRRIDHRGRGVLTKSDFASFMAQARAWRMTLESDGIADARQIAREWTQRAFVDDESKALKSNFPCGPADMQRACELVGLLGKCVDTLNDNLADNCTSLEALDTECTKLRSELEEARTQGAQAADDFRCELIALRQRMRRRDTEQQSAIEALTEQLGHTRAECAQVLQSVKGELIMMSGRANLEAVERKSIQKHETRSFANNTHEGQRAAHRQDGLPLIPDSRDHMTMRLPPPDRGWVTREPAPGFHDRTGRPAHEMNRRGVDQLLGNLDDEERLVSRALSQLNTQLHGRHGDTRSSANTFGSTRDGTKGTRRLRAKGAGKSRGSTSMRRSASDKPRWTST